MPRKKRFGRRGGTRGGDRREQRWCRRRRRNPGATAVRDLSPPGWRERCRLSIGAQHRSPSPDSRQRLQRALSPESRRERRCSPSRTRPSERSPSPSSRRKQNRTNKERRSPPPSDPGRQEKRSASPSRERRRVKRRRWEARRPWWQGELVYQIYPRSFCDSNGDGIGDLKGIESKLDYLDELGVKSVWLNPVYKSPMKDFGYDISDFREIDPIFGTMEDFDSLLAAMKEKDMHLIMDLVPNHSSDQHEWFQRSVRREAPYTDYYVWADGAAGGGPPNNWLSVFGGPAWTYSPERQQYYYHQFLPEQPDLNYRSQDVQQEMADIIRFWLDKGVDGFRLDALKHLYETEDLGQTEPALPGEPGVSWAQLEHAGVTTDLPETLDLLAEWRTICDQYQDKDQHHRLLMAEVYGPTERVMEYYGNGTNMADFPFNFLLVERLKTVDDLTGTKLSAIVDEWRSAQPNDTWANWVLGNHDQPRIASRVGEESVDALNMLLLLLPGTPIAYYGDELGMTNADLTFEQTVDPQGRNCGPLKYAECSRDPQRTPMQWSTEPQAGFSSVKPWLPVNDNFPVVNVASQQEAETSHLKVFQNLMKQRAQSESLTAGDYQELVVDNKTFSFMRLRSGSPGFVVVINTSDQTNVIDLTPGAPKELAAEATVVVRSSHAVSEETRPRSRVQLKSVSLGPREGILLSFVPRPQD